MTQVAFCLPFLSQRRELRICNPTRKRFGKGSLSSQVERNNMNMALYLVVILSSAVGFSQAAAFKPSTEPYQVCIRGCKIEPPQKHYVCVESGRHFYHPCHAECANTTNPDFLKPEDMKVVECEPGSFQDCWNTKCKDEERIDGGEPKMCDKAPPHTYRNWPCQNRCTSLEYEKKDLELVPCSEVKTN